MSVFIGEKFQGHSLPSVGCEPVEYLKRLSLGYTAERLKKAEKKSSTKTKKRRKELKFNKQVKTQRQTEKEGQLYTAGGFNEQKSVDCLKLRTIIGF